MSTENQQDNQQNLAFDDSKKNLNFWAKLGFSGLNSKKLVPLLAVLILGCVLMWLGNDGSAKQAVGEVGENENFALNPDLAVSGRPSETLSPAGKSGADMRSQEGILEAKLIKILSKIQGVGQVDVSLTFAQGSKAEYAVNASTTLRSTEEKDSNGGKKSTTETTENDEMVLESGSNAPVLIQETTAQIQGVLVVAEGGANPWVCTSITQAIAGLLDVPLHKIIICPWGKE